MKRPRHSGNKSSFRNPEQSRRRILRAALTEFALNGFAGARVDAIARRARINKRMLYHYFGDKEVLFREVLRRKMAERIAWMASAPEDPVDYLSQWFQLACRDREWVKLLEWEALQWGEKKKVIDEASRRDGVARALERLRKQQRVGLISKNFEPGQLLLAMLSLTAYPIAFPQISRLVTGLSVSSLEFQKRREKFLRQFAAAFCCTGAK